MQGRGKDVLVHHCGRPLGLWVHKCQSGFQFPADEQHQFIITYLRSISMPAKASGKAATGELREQLYQTMKNIASYVPKCNSAGAAKRNEQAMGSRWDGVDRKWLGIDCRSAIEPIHRSNKLGRCYAEGSGEAGKKGEHGLSSDGHPTKLKQPFRESSQCKYIIPYLISANKMVGWGTMTAS